MSNGINLLVDKRNAKLLTPEKDRLRIFRFGAMALLFLVGASSVILSILILFSPLPQVKRDEQNARATLDEFRLEISKLAFVNERGDSIRKILAGRVPYGKKLDIIESKMQADVKLDGMSIVKNKYTFKFSSKNLLSLDILLKGISDVTGTGRDFQRVYLTSLTMNTEKNSFILVVDLLTI